MLENVVNYRISLETFFAESFMAIDYPGPNLSFFDGALTRILIGMNGDQ